MLYDLTDIDFKEKVLEENGYILVDFWAPWCRGCQSLERVLQNISEDYYPRVFVYKLNVVDFEVISSMYHIKSLPTLILFKSGKILRTLTGLQSENTIKNWLNI